MATLHSSCLRDNSLFEQNAPQDPEDIVLLQCEPPAPPGSPEERELAGYTRVYTVMKAYMQPQASPAAHGGDNHSGNNLHTGDNDGRAATAAACAHRRLPACSATVAARLRAAAAAVDRVSSCPGALGGGSATDDDGGCRPATPELGDDGAASADAASRSGSDAAGSWALYEYGSSGSGSGSGCSSSGGVEEELEGREGEEARSGGACDDDASFLGEEDLLPLRVSAWEMGVGEAAARGVGLGRVGQGSCHGSGMERAAEPERALVLGVEPQEAGADGECRVGLAAATVK
ncbi:hypothetical protein GPECTOR_80g161 [Gonium pectorale]|uniref:Uncharacterized protein n=1 Tax=Gonium pectorale TaxID=33097 RepID=A0A150G1W3_GONPE|nr:hypothetical protein GPECTOR_80g161 [Gonium pectorale]|eukprot:KXZ43801.1 hypothetical protein GPECTOR_80g161 [Gonium pectorale]